MGTEGLTWNCGRGLRMDAGFKSMSPSGCESGSEEGCPAATSVSRSPPVFPAVVSNLLLPLVVPNTHGILGTRQG